MDPNDTVRRMGEAVANRDWLDVLTMAATLKSWVSMGGTAPDGLTRGQAVRLAKRLYDFAEVRIGADYLDIIEQLEGSHA